MLEENCTIIVFTHKQYIKITAEDTKHDDSQVYHSFANGVIRGFRKLTRTSASARLRRMFDTRYMHCDLSYIGLGFH